MATPYKDYKVALRIDLEAKSAQEAAETFLAWIRYPEEDSFPLVFEVTDKAGTVTKVELA